VFTFGEPKDEAEETQANRTSTEASSHSAAASSEPRREETRAPQGKRKWHSLADKVYAPRNLAAAWERVKANGGAPGKDGITVSQYAEHAEEWLTQLAADLRAKTYRPQPVRRVWIPKSDGSKRPLGIPTIRDRIVQQALLQVLGPIFEAKFSRRSHGFRPGKGCVTALNVVDRAVRAGYEWVVDADLQSFFDTVDHERLLTALNEEIADGTVLRLVRRILTAGVILPETATVEPTELGTPQGGPLSPLLANVYLHRFDEAMEAAGIGLVRYADDFVLFAKSEREAEAALALARQVLEGEWGLLLHPEKTRVVSVDEGFEFLGFRYFRDSARGGRFRKEVRRKSVQRFREAVRTRTPRLRGQRKPKARHLTPTRLAHNQRLMEMIKSLNRFLDGWHGYFHAVWSPFPETPFRNFDGFVRRRLRSAITGRRGKGGWHQRLPNALLRDLGLLSLDERQRSRALKTDAAARKGTSGGEPYAGKPHVRFGKAGGRATAP
jgi:RNA-directed DNA polymerase